MLNQADTFERPAGAVRKPDLSKAATSPELTANASANTGKARASTREHSGPATGTSFTIPKKKLANSGVPVEPPTGHVPKASASVNIVHAATKPASGTENAKDKGQRKNQIRGGSAESVAGGEDSGNKRAKNK